MLLFRRCCCPVSPIPFVAGHLLRQNLVALGCVVFAAEFVGARSCYRLSSQCNSAKSRDSCGLKLKACKHGQGRPRCDVLRDFARDSLAASGRLLQVWMRDGVLDLRAFDDPWLHPGDHIRALHHCLVLHLGELGLECLMSRRPTQGSQRCIANRSSASKGRHPNGRRILVSLRLRG